MLNGRSHAHACFMFPAGDSYDGDHPELRQSSDEIISSQLPID
jgi:hypothetical protein